MRNFYAKRLTAALLALFVAWPVLGLSTAGTAHATPAQAAELTIGDAPLQTGQSAVIPVTLDTKDFGVGSYSLQIDFDPAALEIEKIEPIYGNADAKACLTDQQGCFQSHAENEDGWLRAIWVDISGGNRLIAGKQELFKLYVKAKADASSGEKSLSVSAGKPENLTFTTADERTTLPVTVTAGKLSVSQPPAAQSGSKVAIPVYIDGKLQSQSATATTVDTGSGKTTSVAVDNDKVMAQIADGTINRLLLPLGSLDTQSVVSELNGALVKAMEAKEAVVEIRTPQADYTLPAKQINIGRISAAVGEQVSLADIKIRIKIESTSDAVTRSAQAAAGKLGASVVSEPVEFSVSAVYGDKTVAVDRFSGYVERNLPLPQSGSSEGQDTVVTGAVVLPDGTLSPVPSKLVERDGRKYLSINSMTNSAYVVVSHAASFKDMAGHWSLAEVYDLGARLVVQGTSGGSYEPNRAVTRAEFATLVLRALGLRASQSDNTAAYKDVKKDAWYASAVNAADAYKLIGGYTDGSFKPSGTITRAEASVVLMRAAALTGLSLAPSDAEAQSLFSGYTDRDSVPAWARPQIAAALQADLLQGANGKLSPSASVTRAQAAVMLHRLLTQAGLIDKLG